MSLSATVLSDLSTLEQFFALILEQEAEIRASLRGFFAKHDIPNTRPSAWLQDLGNVIAAKHSGSQGWLLDKMSRQTAKLADALPVSNVDARLTSIHAYALTKSESVSRLSDDFFQLGDQLNQEERVSMADMLEKVPASFADLSTTCQRLSERLEPLRPFIRFLSGSQGDITSSLLTSTHFGDVRRILSPVVQTLTDLESETSLIVREATAHRLRACGWDHRTPAWSRSQAIDAMRGRRERLIWLASQQAGVLALLEREIAKASTHPTQVADSDGNELLLRDLFSAASKYKSLCLDVMRAGELKHAINLCLVGAQSTFIKASLRLHSV